MPLGRLLPLGDLVTGCHVVPSLALLKNGVALWPACHLAVHPDALAAAGLAGGKAAQGTDQPAAHLVGEEAAARAEELDAAQAAGPAAAGAAAGVVAGAAARQAAVAFPLQSAGCCRPGWEGGCRRPGCWVFCSTSRFDYCPPG